MTVSRNRRIAQAVAVGVSLVALSSTITSPILYGKYELNDEGDTNVCSENPCKNNGQCSIDGDGYICACNEGFSGANCEINPCDQSLCVNGECYAVDDENFACKCDDGFSGDLCEITPCSNNPCQYGTCEIVNGEYSCSCNTGFSGKNCTIDPCSGDICQNGAICDFDKDDGTFICKCSPEFTGSLCEKEPCASKPCLYEGVCSVSGDGYACLCPGGFSGDNCEITLCTNNPCKNTGECLIEGNSYTCLCPPDFSGKNCETTPCDHDPCENGKCTIEDGNWYCDCDDGFGGDFCDKNICDSGVCKNDASCVYDEEKKEYECICKEGFIGQHCETELCNPNPCMNGGSCHVNGTSYDCSCPQGFYGENCQKTPCTNNPCENAGECTFDENGSFTCSCKDGYSGSLCEIDPCFDHECVFGSCQVDGAGYICNCDSGYSGEFCELDRCHDYPCENNSTCILHVDFAECDCLPGFFGDFCEKDHCYNNTCENGRCEAGEDSYTCDCRIGFSGEFCEITPCDKKPCAYGECSYFGPIWSCECPTELFSGRDCSITPCNNTNPDLPPACFNDGECSMNGDDFVCKCPEFYTGERCETFPCMDRPCQNGGACQNTGDDSFTCECPEDVTGDLCENLPPVTNTCFNTECDGVCIEMDDGPRCFENQLVGFWNNNNNEHSVTCGNAYLPYMLTTPEIEVHHIEIEPTYKLNEYFINTHGCGAQGNCRASFAKEEISSKTFDAENLSTAEEESCVLKTKLADFDELPLIILTSNPGSGNTWSRLLIETATGYYSGSVYNELTMFKNGFIGELEPPTSGRTVVVKSHSNSNSENADGIVMVIRNPYDSFKADFNRQMSSTHTGQVDPKIYNKTEWEQFIEPRAKRWASSVSWFPKYAKEVNIPIKTIFYENLLQDSSKEMSKFLDWYSDNFQIEIPDRENRLSCMSESQGAFYRKKEPLKFEIFKPKMKTTVNYYIKRVIKFYEENNFETGLLETYLKDTDEEEDPEILHDYEKSDERRQKHMIASIDEKVELRKLNKINPLHIYYRSNPMLC
ncbi:Oidioi.mRNA.OKI2018_I69.chr2.g4682.t1.cds [Oikopleura dioica]|uniref:Oidioi.mRNA.OKI2018_I69.chr2.g4682.t1.cds n=1 Tax=Oikopleura dioica TaxID=34765 RepID=A0ABN7T1W6_OIKDI|nr:Oidioi.mRNA.OKI2018_I69.chr2.g4682.t1.cds [Oikopleura dioica]